jgi:hypothetical protein
VTFVAPFELYRFLGRLSALLWLIRLVSFDESCRFDIWAAIGGISGDDVVFCQHDSVPAVEVVFVCFVLLQAWP